MALSIKDTETDRLARELAARSGESITAAVNRALRERLARLDRQRRAPVCADELDAIARTVAAMPLCDDRSEADILGYGPDGLPDR